MIRAENPLLSTAACRSLISSCVRYCIFFLVSRSRGRKTSIQSYYSYIDLYMACMASDMASITLYSETKDLYCYLERNRQSAKERANTIEKLYLSENLCCLSQMDLSKQNVGSICLYFRLSMDDASDITNLIYYFLIKQYMEAEAGDCPVYCQLLIDDGSNNIIRFKITQFLVFESKKENPVFLKVVMCSMDMQ